MYYQETKLDVGKAEVTNEIGRDTATEAFEPGGEVGEVTHAHEYEIPTATTGAEIGKETNGPTGGDEVRDHDAGLRADEMNLGMGPRERRHSEKLSPIKPKISLS